MTIFKAFAARTLLPVKINEVATWVKSGGFAHEIHFHPMDRDPGIVAGLVRVDRFKPPYATDEIVVADIPFSVQISEPEQRITGAKEIVHILDEDQYVAGTYKALSALIADMATPLELIADMSKLSVPGAVDHGGILGALAVLFPPAARELLLDLRKRGCIGNKEVAALANIPENYVEYLLGERWGTVLTQLCK